MIQVKNLTITHRKDMRVILESFSMVLNDGDKAALIGEEGNGKSTLLKLLYDERLVEDYAEYSGEIIKNRARIGYLAQELTEEQKAQSVYEFCAQSDVFYEQSPKELAAIAGQLGLSSDIFYADQRMGQLSGGEKVKLQLARLLMEQPDVLFLDEPSNDIDIETIEWLERFICKASVPVLFISHDETLLERTANKIIHMEQLRRKTTSRCTVAAVDYRTYVSARADAFLHQEQVARKERSEYEKQQERFRKIQQKVEHQQNAISRNDPHGGRLLKKKMHAVKSLERRFEKEHSRLTELPETEEAIFIKFGDRISMPQSKRVLDFSRSELRTEAERFGEGKLLARELRLSITGPEHVCIVGKNGAGKTTLLKEIAGELLARDDVKAYYMPQNYEELLDLEQTPVEFLCAEGSWDEVSRVRTYLGSMKYTADEMAHPASALSGGQKAKLLFLKMSMAGCNVLILDEPTRNFSPLSNPVIRGMLKEYGGTIISVSHDRKYIDEVCDTVYELTKTGLQRISERKG